MVLVFSKLLLRFFPEPYDNNHKRGLSIINPQGLSKQAGGHRRNYKADGEALRDSPREPGQSPGSTVSKTTGSEGSFQA